jgi:hypothetical protein
MDVATPTDEVALPTFTPQRTEKFFGMRALGCGAGLFPYLGLHEARALRLLNKLLKAAVDRRAWVCTLACTYGNSCMFERICVMTVCLFVAILIKL